VKRVLVCEPDPDIRHLLELTVTRLGHEPVSGGDADVVLMEPSCPVAQRALRRFARRVPPVVCLSVHPREAGFAPPETVAYLMKPIRKARLAAALTGVLAP
jgi:CheY-like chemotaxis protein